MIYFPKSNNVHPCLEIEKAKKSGNYNCGEVLNTLKSDFKNKCYLCEVKEPHTINIEHFKPYRTNDIDLKFDWNNLFYCCGHCNNTKLAKREYDEILNCTIEADQVETKIKYGIKPMPKEIAIIEVVENSPIVVNTVNLLKEIFNGEHTMHKKIESANIRSMLLKEIRAFQSLLFEFEDDSYNAEEKEELKQKIVRELRPTSNFTAFKRWLIRESSHFSLIFSLYIN